MAKKEKKVKAEKQTGSVGFFQSMRFKILLMTLIGVLLSIVISLGIIVPRVQSQTKQTNLNYLEDLANAYGELINKEIDMIGYNNTMNYSRLNSSLGDAGVEGMSTSYAYLVDAQGIMMYHPDESKIGSEVANSMVKGLVEKLMAGENLANQIDAIEYEYKGSTKFASYRVGKKNDYILVVTVDKDEIFAELSALVGLALIVGVVIFVLVALACIALTGYLFGPLTTLTNIINKLASLDLTKNQGTEKILKRKDEIGVIGSAIRSLRKEMSSMIEELSGESDKLLEANASFIEKFTEISENVSNVNVAVEEIAEGSTSQAQETTAAGEQVANIGNVIEVNVRNVEKLEETAHEMSELSEKAAATLESLQSINEQTSENIKIVSEQTNNTNASAAKIQEAVTLIQDIASQTNLLSLNASIEAARAGEAGRGFAVVAEEIRKLADDSAASANEINQIVEELIANSNQSVGKMAEVTQDAQKQVKELQSTIDSFDSLRTCVQEVSDASENIAEQMADLEKQKNIISGVVEQLAAISEENAASTEETSASMQTLSETVQQCQEETAALNELGAALTETVGKFKV